MKNVYQKFICAVILICSQIYMLLYDVKASFGLMDLFIICLFYYLLMKRKIEDDRKTEYYNFIDIE